VTAWGAAKAKAEFGTLLDKAESEGPQLVKRRKKEFFVVMTKEQPTEQTPESAAERPFVSAWDALRPSSGVDFPRAASKPRVAKL
jgi:prevent-host-death family protein